MADTSWIGSMDVRKYTQDLLQKEVDALTLKEQKGPFAQLGKIQRDLSTQLSTYGTLQSYLTNFKNDLNNLINGFTSNSNLTVSDATAVKAEASGIAAQGSHTLSVTQLATSKTIASTMNITSTTSGLGLAEQIQITAGSKTFSVDVVSDDSLQKVMEKINSAATAAHANVNASIVSTGTNDYKLVLSGTLSGTVNDVTVSGTNSLGITNVLSTAQNAQFKFDNLDYDVASNSNIISGINITLLKSGTVMSPLVSHINVSPANQVSTVVDMMSKVVNDYNMIDQFVEKTQTESATTDSSLDAIMMTLQSAMDATFQGSGSIKTLSQLGLSHDYKAPTISVTYYSADPDAIPLKGDLHLLGQLKLDTAKMSSVLTSNFNDVKNMMSDSFDGLFTKLNAMLQPTSGSIDKILNGKDDVKKTQGSVLTAKQKLKEVNDQIDKENLNFKALKDQLVMKYANLEFMLSNLQSQSQYVSQQINVWNNSKS